MPMAFLLILSTGKRETKGEKKGFSPIYLSAFLLTGLLRGKGTVFRDLSILYSPEEGRKGRGENRAKGLPLPTLIIPPACLMAFVKTYRGRGGRDETNASFYAGENRRKKGKKAALILSLRPNKRRKSILEFPSQTKGKRKRKEAVFALLYLDGERNLQEGGGGRNRRLVLISLSLYPGKGEGGRCLLLPVTTKSGGGGGGGGGGKYRDGTLCFFLDLRASRKRGKKGKYASILAITQVSIAK